jgi:hypothetical protein
MEQSCFAVFFPSAAFALHRSRRVCFISFVFLLLRAQFIFAVLKN